MNKILNGYRNLFDDCGNKKHYGMIGKKIPADLAFRLMDDIINEFHSSDPEIFYTVYYNCHQDNCMFIDLLIDNFGLLCSFWGYGVDSRSGKYTPGFNLHIGTCHMKKQDYKFLNYKICSVSELRSQLAELIERNLGLEDMIRRGVYDIGIKA